MTTSPTTPIPDEAVEAAAEAMHHGTPDGWVISFSSLTEGTKRTWRKRAHAALAAALPALVAEAVAAERERIAEAIEAVRSPSLSLTENGHLEHAARIARGGADQ